jgi:hypothetical protein
MNERQPDARLTCLRGSKVGLFFSSAHVNRLLSSQSFHELAIVKIANALMAEPNSLFAFCF